MLGFCTRTDGTGIGELRTKILSKLEQNPKMSLKIECERIENVRHHAVRIEKRDISKINAVKQNNEKKNLPIN